MDNMQQHWENVYSTKQPNEVSWTQPIPQTSIHLIRSFHLPKTAKIIDIGGGDSLLADFLLNEGYTDITVLDISATALERAQVRLGTKAASVKWIISDILDFKPTEQYDVWHDRAAFHFLTTDEQLARYATIVNQYVKGYLVMGTFSDAGPKKCSGLEITQYTEDGLAAVFSENFERIDCLREDHTTPFNTIQNFVFCTFKRRLG